ncbi:hypothetical protein N7513_001991 [Penicillium frequentans]|uniref:Uncharacterized protein n=1 Tax=Penicillium frequentans TaxID=3151616 RepID=A0AAD6CRP5_9EURO|nr:hypothetical protein N7494_008930 [Penicillium glabrum]KAJ5559592.1 hypothetical protein N7513_001991 [Penicillium glabrum]
MTTGTLLKANLVGFFIEHNIEDNNNQQAVQGKKSQSEHFPAETYSELDDAPAESCPGPEEATDDHSDR